MDPNRIPEQSEHTGQAPSIVEHRPTRFELVSITIKANGLEVSCVERGVYGAAPVPMLLEEGKHLGPAHIAYGREAAEALEKLFEARIAEHEDPELPANRHRMMREKSEAQAARDAAQKEHDKLQQEIASANEALVAASAQKAETEAQHARLAEEHARIQTEVALAQAQHAEIKAAIEAAQQPPSALVVDVPKE